MAAHTITVDLSELTHQCVPKETIQLFCELLHSIAEYLFARNKKDVTPNSYFKWVHNVVPESFVLSKSGAIITVRMNESCLAIWSANSTMIDTRANKTNEPKILHTIPPRHCVHFFIYQDF